MMKPVPLLIVSVVSLIILFSFFSENEVVDEPVQEITQQTKAQNDSGFEFSESSKKDPLINNKGIQQSFRGVAKSYAAQSRFPASSMPIQDEASLQKYIPNQAVGASLPYEGPNGEAWRFGLRTDQFRYFKGEEIKIFVTLTGDNNQLDSDVTIAVVADRKVIHEVGRGSLSAGYFQASIDTDAVNTSSWPKELHIQAIAELDGEYMQVLETIRFEESIAEVEGVGKGSVDNEYLVIPVELDTDARGYFRVTAVLFSQSSNKPLVHLEGKSKITVNNDTVELKAHIDALRVSGDEGPYEIQHLYVEKMPGPPDYASAFGKTNDQVYPVSAQSFDSYADADYENPSAQRSLEFLNKMGGNQTQN